MSPDRRSAGQDPVTAHEIPGGWTEQEIRLGAHRFRLVLPAEPDTILEQLLATHTGPAEPPDPFWARLWPCAAPMAAAVLGANWRPGQPALELGCGVGLVGLAALAAGLRVTFSDCEPLAVAVALENARRNGFATARGLLLDWKAPGRQRYPLIFGSDLLYDRANHQPVLDVLQQMLSAGGECWLGDPGRYHAARFLQRAKQLGFEVRRHGTTPPGPPPPRSEELQLWVLRRP